jgi:hypothetical protein
MPCCRAQQHVFLLSSAALLTAMLALPAAAPAAPLNLTQTINGPNGSSIVGELHGDLANNVLTLNPAAPLSGISFNLGSVSRALPTLTDKGRIHDNAFFSVDLTTTSNITLALSTWRLNAGGTVDFGAGTANLTLAPGAAKTIFTMTEATSLAFSGHISPGFPEGAKQVALDAALALLNAADINLHATTSASWLGAIPGTASAAFSQNGGTAQVDLGLTSTLLYGIIDTNVTLDAAKIVDILGDIANIDAFLRDLYVAPIFDGFVGLAEHLGEQIPGVDIDCGRATNATALLAGANIQCEISAQLSMVGPWDTPEVSAVPEPATLGMFGGGLAALALMRRRRPA